VAEAVAFAAPTGPPDLNWPSSPVVPRPRCLQFTPSGGSVTLSVSAEHVGASGDAEAEAVAAKALHGSPAAGPPALTVGDCAAADAATAADITAHPKLDTRRRSVVGGDADTPSPDQPQPAAGAAGQQPPQEQLVRMRFEVQDSGIGMTAATMQRLFKPFAQADSSTTRRFGGTGLGLAITKHLATLMHGGVGVSSELGAGSTFWFTVLMPVAAPHAASATAADAGPRRSRGSQTGSMTASLSLPPHDSPRSGGAGAGFGSAGGASGSPRSAAAFASSYFSHPDGTSPDASAVAAAAAAARALPVLPGHKLTVSAPALATGDHLLTPPAPLRAAAVELPATTGSAGPLLPQTHSAPVLALAIDAAAADSGRPGALAAAEASLASSLGAAAMSSQPLPSPELLGAARGQRRLGSRFGDNDESPSPLAAPDWHVTRGAGGTALFGEEGSDVSAGLDADAAHVSPSTTAGAHAPLAAAAPVADVVLLPLVSASSMPLAAFGVEPCAAAATAGVPPLAVPAAAPPAPAPLTTAVAAVPQSRAARPAAVPPAHPDARVLAAEDNAVNQRILTQFLRKLGYRSVSVVENGALAVDAVVATRPDVILMDCQMPVCDGYEATRRIRAMSDPALRGVPIIALTASALPADIARCAAAGMNDHLAKPYDSASLAAKLAAWLSDAKPASLALGSAGALRAGASSGDSEGGLGGFGSARSRAVTATEESCVSAGAPHFAAAAGVSRPAEASAVAGGGGSLADIGLGLTRASSRTEAPLAGTGMPSGSGGSTIPASVDALAAATCSSAAAAAAPPPSLRVRASALSAGTAAECRDDPHALDGYSEGGSGDGASPFIGLIPPPCSGAVLTAAACVPARHSVGATSGSSESSASTAVGSAASAVGSAGSDSTAAISPVEAGGAAFPVAAPEGAAPAAVTALVEVPHTAGAPPEAPVAASGTAATEAPASATAAPAHPEAAAAVAAGAAAGGSASPAGRGRRHGVMRTLLRRLHTVCGGQPRLGPA